ncbi:glycosyl hydrolase [Bradyrhizobium sp. NP1]|uniref:glycosyl hydrolase n=1 Tax=Bradyrhizobium sp. NP1 TaxID=3049772 RepID=UPI0025A599BA|nr:glycosyl hydrolase [Bradyrhizobium sp. NP1]WJR81421.1 glycosyl hydrolase [Bradyrhizobium sp. NP1]
MALLPVFALGGPLSAALAADAPSSTGVTATSSDTFLSSLGVNTHIDQGYNPYAYVEPLRYLGVRNIRDSHRHLTGHLMLHAQTGVMVDLLGIDVSELTAAARILARAGALLAIEGPNEPNNFPITYKGRQGGGTSLKWLPAWTPDWLVDLLPSGVSWLPVAELQRDLYSAVKNDPELSRYPVFHVSEGGAETDNVGLQFLTIPAGAETLLAEGTGFADYANAHNYVSGVRAGYVDNQAWQAADPVLDGRWDGLYGEYGRTWKRHFPGYSNAQLLTLPRVTTETGWDAASPEEERTQGIVLVNTYLAQFKRGWRYTFIYQLGEGEGGGGNQGLFHPDWTPKLAATYIHNLTSILADNAPVERPRQLNYTIANAPPTVHDLLLQKSNGTFELIVWGEQVSGHSAITVDLGEPRPKVRIYDVTAGTTPIQVLTAVNSVPLTLSDHALVLEIE